MIDRKIFSDRLKCLRERRGDTLAEVAAALSVSRQSIHQWEKTETFPNADKLAALADYLDVSVDYLLGRTDNPFAHKNGKSL